MNEDIFDNDNTNFFEKFANPSLHFLIKLSEILWKSIRNLALSDIIFLYSAVMMEIYFLNTFKELRISAISMLLKNRSCKESPNKF